MNNMSRRPRRFTDTGGGGLSSSGHSHNKSESSSWISACILFIAMVLFFGYLFGSSVFHHYSKSAVVASGRKIKPALTIHNLPVEDHVNTASDNDLEEVQHNTTADVLERPVEQQADAGLGDAIPLLQDLYGKYMRKVLHIGPGTCDVVARLLREEGALAWGIEPSDLRTPSSLCKSLVKKGLVRVADVYRSLPYRSKTFSMVLTSYTLENLTSRQLNRTLPEIARLTDHAIVAFVSSRPSETDAVAVRRRLQSAIKHVKHHNRTWWARKFETAGLEEDEDTTKQFENLQAERSITTSDFIFHLHPRRLD